MNHATFFSAFNAAAKNTLNNGAFIGKQFEVIDEVNGNILSFSMGISANAPAHADWSVSTIFRKKAGDQKTKLVFLHQKQDGRPHLRSIVTDHFDQSIIVVSDNNGLDGVYPLQDLCDGFFVPSKVGGKNVPRLVSGGLSLQQRYELKLAIAEQMNLNPIWTPGEEAIANKSAVVRRAQQEADRKAKAEKAEAERLANQERKQEKIAALFQRPKAQAFTADGGKRHGVPIEADGEDEVLDDNTFCIRMQNGVPVEAYVLRKKPNGRVSCTNKAEVFATRDAASGDCVDIGVIDQQVVEIDGETLEVSVFKTFHAIEEMRIKHGLNSGTIVGVAAEKEGGKMKLYSVTKQASKLVGSIAA